MHVPELPVLVPAATDEQEQFPHLPLHKGGLGGGQQLAQLVQPVSLKVGRSRRPLATTIRNLLHLVGQP